MSQKTYRALYALLILLTGLAVATQTLAKDRERGSRETAPKPEISSLSPESGAVGVLVSIAGKNFGAKTGKAAVRFGNQSASAQSWSSGKIVAKAPQGSGEVKVVVVNAQGVASDGKSFKYTSGGGGGGGSSSSGPVTVLANNDLGMHCVDKGFGILSLLPPFNVVNAQVLTQDLLTGKPKLLDSSQVILRYSAVPVPANGIPQGSINSTSGLDNNGAPKTDFWDYAPSLFGVNLPVGQGLTGLYMPAQAPTLEQTQFSWSKGLGMFSAAGIPIIPIDDAGIVNRYPLLRVTAFDKVTNKEMGRTDVVIPVSEETTCSGCHATGKQAALGVGWSDDPDLDKQARINVLRLHDARQGTNLVNGQPVLCASCHYSPALDLAGTGPTGNQAGKPGMSRVMHDFHKAFKTVDGKTLYDELAPVAALVKASNPNGVPPADQQTCYQCHPGKDTKCLRGAMTETVTCQNCHGGMEAVGGTIPLQAYGAIDNRNGDLNRHPWADEPRCQSCHTGDAVNHLVPSDPSLLAADKLRLILAYDPSDASASPRKADNSLFAEEDGKLFRFSKGHGGIACEGCHGSTHAIWPGDAEHPNDDIAPKQIQGHAGTIAECSACHKPGSLPMTLGGPHGMHDVSNAWLSESAHPARYKQNPNSCKTCHGPTLRGSVLSRAAANRTFSGEGAKSIAKGTQVGCWTCHNGPDDD
jgi:hypothetical protein